MNGQLRCRKAALEQLTTLERQGLEVAMPRNVGDLWETDGKFGWNPGKSVEKWNGQREIYGRSLANGQLMEHRWLPKAHLGRWPLVYICLNHISSHV